MINLINMDREYKGLKENLERFNNDLIDEKIRLLFSIAYKQGYDKALSIADVSKCKFNLNELRHIAVNFAITCEKGYKGDFGSWFNGISGEWEILI